MLITCQKFRLHILGHYIRSCHIITCNMHETWGLFYSHTMRTLPMSCHVVLHVQWHHARIVWRMHAGKQATLCIRGAPGITYGHAICASQMIFMKTNHLTFWHPKCGFCKPEHAEKDSHCHAQWEQGQLEWELQDMCRGTHSTSVQVVDIIRPVGMAYNKNKFISGPFWTHKLNQSKIHQYFQHTSPVECPCFYSPCRSNSGQFGCWFIELL